jgi:hypothetical protein
MAALVALLSSSSSEFTRKQAGLLLGDLVQASADATPGVVHALAPLLGAKAWEVRAAAADAVYHVSRLSRGITLPPSALLSAVYCCVCVCACVCVWCKALGRTRWALGCLARMRLPCLL